jgi:hypothetical protein
MKDWKASGFNISGCDIPELTLMGLRKIKKNFSNAIRRPAQISKLPPLEHE